MAKLTIRADELVATFESQSWEMRHFLDRQTGEVLIVFTDEINEEEEEGPEAHPDRYLLIEPVDSRDIFEIMSDFVETLPESRVQRELAWALGRKRPFRRFKDVLLNHPSVREDWFRFHQQAFIKVIKDWLEHHGVEAEVVPFHARS
jgi:hypothetical protein